MISCRWSAHRLQRYLDADPSAPLDRDERERLEDHLRRCERCTGLRDEYRGLSRLLGRLGSGTQPDPESVARLRHRATSLLQEPTA